MSWFSRAWQSITGGSFPPWFAQATMEGGTGPGQAFEGGPNLNVGATPRVVNFENWWPQLDERRALGHPALWRAVNIIAGSIASMPIHAFRGLERLEPASRLLTLPSPSRPRAVIWHQMMESVLMHGNGIAILSDPDRLGYPQRMRPIHPLRVAARLVDGEIEEYAYYPNGDNGNGNGDSWNRPVRWLDPTEVLHIRGLTIPGEAFGLGCLEVFQRSLGLADYLHEHARGWFEGAGIPSGILQLANPNPSQAIVDKAKEDWMNKHTGPQREPAVLPGDVEFKPMATTPEASQLLQSRQYSNLEIALMFGVPPYMLEAQQPGRSLTYSTTEMQGIDFVRFTLLYWMTQIEEALSVLIPGVQYVKFNVDGLLRASTLDRYKAHEIALNAGWLSVDEVRRLEGRPPFEEPSQEGQPAEQPPGPQTPEFRVVGGQTGNRPQTAGGGQSNG